MSTVTPVQPASPVMIINPKSGSFNFFLWFIFIFVGLIILSWIFAPAFLLKKDALGVGLSHQLDWGKTILIDLVVALIVVAIIYAFSK